MRYIFLLGSTSSPPSPHLVCQANLPTTPAFFNILGSRLKIAHHFHLFSSTSWLAGHWRFHATKKSHRIDFVSTHATCGASGWSSWVGHGWFLQDGADNRSWLMGSLLLQMEMALMEMEMAFTGSQGKLRQQVSNLEAAHQFPRFLVQLQSKFADFHLSLKLFHWTTLDNLILKY